MSGCHTGSSVRGGGKRPKHGSLGGSWGLAPPDFLHPLRLIIMKIAAEGLELGSVPFKKILDVFKARNRRIEFN